MKKVVIGTLNDKLIEHIQAVEKLHRQVTALRAAAGEKAYKLGVILLQMREEVEAEFPRGWRRFCKENLSFNRETIQKYIRIARSVPTFTNPKTKKAFLSLPETTADNLVLTAQRNATSVEGFLKEKRIVLPSTVSGTKVFQKKVREVLKKRTPKKNAHSVSPKGREFNCLSCKGCPLRHVQKCVHPHFKTGRTIPEYEGAFPKMCPLSVLVIRKVSPKTKLPSNASITVST